jgi:hypothetical protein
MKENKTMTSRRVYEPNKNETLLEEVLTELYILKGVITEKRVEKQIDKIRKTLTTERL